MIGLYAISSIPGKPPDNPTIIQYFPGFSPTVHNMLHIPAYALLAWTLQRCLFPYLLPRIGLTLVVIMAASTVRCLSGIRPIPPVDTLVSVMLCLISSAQ
ncbi:hypothetical protein [Nitrosomonas sp. Is37]|uniref:hypothetical protein n=1 Tax=Nitrosomonas sp. Is37 TaxID=3080535 RepID=UPI00294ACC20|nr:hypothetical protein [Nitrosomonas sp. Is37]MDV6343050.1 hypothetical protein [Nitrosomonas sp. Is37]